jgi:Plasmid pRiA4b ORF-3-like protein
MSAHITFKRLILRAVLRNVSPLVVRVIATPDSLDLHQFDEVFCSVLGWDNIGFLFRVHGQEFTSFRRATRSKYLREFQLRPRETFLYTRGAIDLWEWEFRLLDEAPGAEGENVALCLGGRGAAPPQHCGGPTGYRMMLMRQKRGEAMCTPVADGGGHRNAGRLGPGRADQHLADAARSAPRWLCKH